MSRRNIVVLFLLVSLFLSNLVQAQTTLFNDINVPSLPAGYEVTLSFEAQVPSDLAPGARISAQATVNADALASSVISDDPATSGAFFDPTLTPTELGVSELPATGQSPWWRTALLWGGPLLALGALFLILRSRRAQTGITLVMLVFLAGMVVNAQSQPPAVFPLLVDGLCGPGDGDSFADADETICYRLRVINGESTVNLSALDIDVATPDTPLTPVSGSVSVGEPVCANLAEVNNLRERIGRAPLDSLPCDAAPTPAPAPDDDRDNDDDDGGSSVSAAATDDSVTVSNDSSSSINVLDNDDGDSASVIRFSENADLSGPTPADGTSTLTISTGTGTLDITLDSDGTFDVTTSPGAGTGTATVYYEIEAADGSTDTAQVTINYESVSATADDDTAVVSNGANNTINVLDNDAGDSVQAIELSDDAAFTAPVPADGTTVLSVSAGGGTLDIMLDASGTLDITANGTTGTGTVTVFYSIEAADTTTGIAQVDITYGDFPVATDDTLTTLGAGNEYATDVGTDLMWGRERAY